MTDDMYAAVTRVAREFRTYRYPDRPDHPLARIGERLYYEWPELWQHLDQLQREWLE